MLRRMGRSLRQIRFDPCGGTFYGDTVTHLRYIVYFNDANNKAVGHITTCRYAGPVEGEASSRWSDVLDSTREAERIGHLSGHRFHWCGLCCRQIVASGRT